MRCGADMESDYVPGVDECTSEEVDLVDSPAMIVSVDSYGAGACSVEDMGAAHAIKPRASAGSSRGSRPCGQAGTDEIHRDEIHLSGTLHRDLDHMIQ